MRRLIPLFWAFVLVFARVARAANCFSISAPSTISVSWTTSYLSQMVSFSVTKTSGANCAYVVGATAGGAGTGNYSSRRAMNGTSPLSYQLYTDSGMSNVLEDKPFSGASHGLSGTLTNSTPVTLTFYLQIPLTSQPTNTLPISGTFTDSFALHGYNGTTSNPGGLQRTVTETLNVAVPKLVELSFVDSGSFVPGQTTKTLNFGTITSAQSLSFLMYVRGNAGYSISFSSTNNGVMGSSTAGVSTTVPYTLNVGGATEDLSSSSTTPVQVASGSGQTTMAGVSNTVSVTTGSTSLSLAATYTDTITITVTSTQ